MPQDPFPLPPGDAEEPDGFPLPPAAEDAGPEGMGQGLYVCLPAEQVTLAGFAQGGQADTMTPGPLLGTVVHTVTGPDGQGLAGCSDDQLLGIISAARRLEARAAWTELAAITAYAARHAGSRPADEFAPVELGFELHLTPQSAAEQMDYASAVARRLPQTFAALAAGRIDAPADHRGRDQHPQRHRRRRDHARSCGVTRRTAAATAMSHLRPLRPVTYGMISALPSGRPPPCAACHRPTAKAAVCRLR
jgi:hypothetical protein